ncbi:MAG: hypothetical protein H6741_21290 [Alphaproteobacteria bacterium]|nr:hypothetical protein [Alphaproteobacteria bacterium]
MTRFLTTLALLSVASTALAGYQSTGETYIHVNSDGSGNAWAVIANVHDSSEYVSRAGCMIRADDPAYELLSCTVTAADGTQATCASFDPLLIDAARGLSDASRLFFSFDSAAQCTLVGVTNGSLYL